MSPRHGGTTAGFSTATRLAATAAPRRRLPSLPALTVLGHPDLGRIGGRVLLGELAGGREALLARHQPRFTDPVSGRGAPLDDPFLSRRPLRFVPLADGGVELARGGCRMSVAVGGVELAGEIALDAGALDGGVVLELARRVVLLLHRHPPEEEAPGERFGLVGESAAMTAVRAAVANVAGLEVPVLVRGETGTGKELVAGALHSHGRRRGGPFVSVNLASLPPALAAAELFGATKGAYTGAVRQQPGFFGRADGGTLFLDEVGEAPPELQVLLLRALETGEVLPLGSQTPRRVDVRVVSATDADLDRLLAGDGFRSPLLHRLAGYTVHLPPLRRRRDDLGRLLAHFLRRELERLGEALPGDPGRGDAWLPAALVARLARYSWPGNVRQLENVARQLVIDSRGRPTLGAGARLEELLPEPPASERRRRGPGVPQPPPSAPAEPPARRRKPSQVSEGELLAALRAARWELKATARALGLSRTSLYARIERSPRVRAAADVPPEEIRAAWQRHPGDLEAMVEELEVSARALRQRLKDLGLR